VSFLFFRWLSEAKEEPLQTMTTVAPLPQLLSDAPSMQDPSALARKRRREIIQSQRAAVVPIPDVSASTSILSTVEVARKKLKSCASADATIVTNQQQEVPADTCTTSCAKPNTKATSKRATKKSGAAKKPQMKYDPDVPMTKEEAAVWRREQRRKRNRESAAASRQRQRDRIAELEVERDEWKKNYEQVMLKLQELEEETGIPSSGSEMPIQTKSMSTADLEKTIVSPPSSPEVSPRSSPTCSPIASCSLLDTGRILEEVPGQEHHIFEKEEEKQLLNKMISRPA